MYEKGAQYRTVNNARSAISKLNMGFNGLPAGQHPLVQRALKAVFRLRPPLPKFKATFKIKPVLTYTSQIFGNNDFLNLKYLSYKCLFLLSFTSISRISTLCGLGASVEEYPEFAIVPLLKLEKQARGTLMENKLVH